MKTGVGVNGLVGMLHIGSVRHAGFELVKKSSGANEEYFHGSVFVGIYTRSNITRMPQNPDKQMQPQMEKQIVRTDQAPAPIGPYSQAVSVHNMLFVSGQVAIDPRTGEFVVTDIRSEAELVMANIKAILDKAGFQFSHVVKSTIFLSDMNNFKDVNEIYGAAFPTNPPARETVQVSRLPKDANVEISVIAVK